MHSQRRRWERVTFFKGVTRERHDMHSQRRRWERVKTSQTSQRAYSHFHGKLSTIRFSSVGCVLRTY
jgi:hypothetical protein